MALVSPAPAISKVLIATLDNDGNRFAIPILPFEKRPLPSTNRLGQERGKKPVLA
jgi:hypothetical protein